MNIKTVLLVGFLLPSTLFSAAETTKIGTTDSDVPCNDYILVIKSSDTIEDKVVQIRGLNEVGTTDINQPDEDEGTPLMIAIGTGTAENNFHAEVIDALLEHPDIDVDFSSKYLPPALLLAAQNGNIHAIEAIRCQGGDLNVVSYNESNALHYGARCKKPEVMRRLLELDIEWKENIFGETPYFDAATEDCPEMLELLFEHRKRDLVGLNAHNCKMETPLHNSARSGTSHVAEKILDLGAFVDPLDECQRTPLHLAAEEGHFNIMLELLAKEANQKACSEWGNVFWHSLSSQNKEAVVCARACVFKDSNEPLHTGYLRKACFDSSKEVIEYAFTISKKDLLHKCKKSSCTSKGTLLHIAAQNNACQEILPYLLKQAQELGLLNKIINAQRNPTKRTALHDALYSDNYDNAYALLRAGASIGIEDKQGRLPIHVFLRSLWVDKEIDEVERLLPLLVCHSSVMRNLICPMIVEGDQNPIKLPSLTVLEILGFLPIVVSLQDENGRTLLHHLANTQEYDHVDQLLTAGADSCIKDASGCYAHQVDDDFIVDKEAHQTIALIKQAFDEKSQSQKKSTGHRKKKKKKKKKKKAPPAVATTTVIATTTTTTAAVATSAAATTEQPSPAQVVNQKMPDVVLSDEEIAGDPNDDLFALDPLSDAEKAHIEEMEAKRWAAAAIKIQAYARGMSARVKYQKLLRLEQERIAFQKEIARLTEQKTHCEALMKSLRG